MILKRGKEFVFECDACGDNLETDEDEFHDALNFFKDADWRAEKFDDVWVHHCFGCAESVQ
jgi:hypothetical protein